MKIIQLPMAKQFKILATTPRSQAAEMVVPPGQSEGGPDNRHKRSDQWLFVLAGQGRAKVGKKVVRIKRGTLLLIPRNEPHQISCMGKTALRSLNFYARPAY
jgi:mannose-6-phosphate isomerase-like protein (cupin superfamily)